MHRSRVNAQSTASPILIGATVLICASLALPGCYQRVVKAKGLGADSVTVQESYQESSKLDDWLFGPEVRPSSKSTPLNR